MYSRSLFLGCDKITEFYTTSSPMHWEHLKLQFVFTEHPSSSPLSPGFCQPNINKYLKFLFVKLIGTVENSPAYKYAVHTYYI